MISTSEQGPVTVLRLEHGKVNPQDAELLEALRAEVSALAARGAPPLVVTGAGRAFSAGVDLTRFLDGGTAYLERLLPALSGAFVALFGYPGATVAAVNGAAIAGGCILAAACDRRIVAEGARIGASELKVGVAFPAAAVEVLRHACGDRTEEVVLTGALYAGAEAVRVGLAHEVVPPDGLLDRAVAVAGELASGPAEPYRLAKEQLRRPVMARIAADAEVLDPRVREVWASEETARTVRAYLDATVKRS